MSIESILLQKLRERNAELEAENAKLKSGIDAINVIISESQGVYGLHLNGDPSPWAELLEGGRHEEWLYDFSQAGG